MKQNKRIPVLLVGCLLLAGTAFALEAGDTLISQNYFLSTLLAPIEEQVEEKVQDYMDEGYDTQVENLDEVTANLEYLLVGGDEGTENAVVQSIEYGQGDVITLKTGATLVASAGRVLLTHDGTVVDATSGELVESGSDAKSGHRYIVAEDTTLTAEVLSGLATMGYSGTYAYRAGTGKNHPFYDVYSTDYYNDAVSYVYSYGLFEGDGNTFSPAVTMDRSMVVTVLYRLAGEPENQMANAMAIDNPFRDVEDAAWFAPYVRWAANEAVSEGDGNGSFFPNQPVTVIEMAQFLYNFGETKLGLSLEGSVDLLTLEDGDQVPDWASDAVQWAASSGVWTGSFAYKPASRGDIAVLLMNFTQIYGN